MMRFSLLFVLFGLLILPQALAAAIFPEYQYIYPLPNSNRVSPQTTIIVRLDGEQPVNLVTFIQVADENGGIHGTTRIASDNQTIIFRPDAPFEFGSTITVALSPPSNSSIPKIEYQFKVATTPAVVTEFVPEDERQHIKPLKKTTLQADENTGARIMPNGVSVPSDFPHITVTTNSAPGDGYIFLNNRGRGTPYNIIFDNDGSPVWYMRTTDRRRDFKIQYNGTISMLGRSGGHRFINFDHNFNHLRDYSAVDGYSTDEHECIITEEGNVLLIGRREETVDMTAYVSGAQRNATVRETVIQEFTPNGDKIFQWRAWDHFEDVLEFLELENLQGGYIRFPHMNAIDIDYDGHILLSSRHLSEVSKINRQTGEFIWRLGGPENEFDFVNDELGVFKNQHAVLSLGNNHYTVFDNGTSRFPNVSRGIEYELDVEKKTATVVWEYRNPEGTSYSHYMGNHQRLPNGNSLINWAVSNRPKLTEVTPDGQVVYEMNWSEPDECYRAFRFPWDGVVEQPSLYVEQVMNDVELIFNKFGDKNVVYYNIYADFSPNATTVIDTSKRTMKVLSDLENNKQYYVRVAAVYANGSVSEFSNEEAVLIQKVEPGVNLILNGDFSHGKDSWIFELQGNGDAEWDVKDGVAHFKISDGGEPHYSVQLRQNAMPLVTGQKYLFEFDAWADAPKTIEAKVGMDDGPWTNYSGIGLTALARSKKHFAYEFTMEYAGDANGRVVFNVGESDADVYLQNASLKILSTVDVDNALFSQPTDFNLVGNFPNPFNSKTYIRFSTPKQIRVNLELFNIRGQFERTIVNKVFEKGQHSVIFDAYDLTSGVYFCRMTTDDNSFNDVHKLILMK